MFELILQQNFIFWFGSFFTSALTVATLDTFVYIGGGYPELYKDETCTLNI